MVPDTSWVWLYSSSKTRKDSSKSKSFKQNDSRGKTNGSWWWSPQFLPFLARNGTKMVWEHSFLVNYQKYSGPTTSQGWTNKTVCLIGREIVQITKGQGSKLMHRTWRSVLLTPICAYSSRQCPFLHITNNEKAQILWSILAIDESRYTLLGVILWKMQTKSTAPICHTIPSTSQSKMGKTYCQFFAKQTIPKKSEQKKTKSH